MGLFSKTQTASFASKIFNNKKSTEPMVQMTSFKPSFANEYKSKHLKRAFAESEGVPSPLIHSFLKAVAEDRTLNVHDIIIMRNGKILCEAAFGAQRLDIWKYTFSACKSIVSLAIGFLVDDKVLSLDERIIDIFKEEAPTLFKLKMKNLTVRDLLTMRSGVMFGEVESATEQDWLKGFFSASTKGEVGKDFNYNSLNTYLLSVIVTRKTKMSLSDFLDKRLFTPLGIARDSWFWEKSPQEIEKGGWGLFLFPEDFCKIGQLVMQNGIWEGNRLISESYLKDATYPHVKVSQESSYFNYGYQIWVGKHTDTFLFNGMLGQNVIGFKKNGIIIVSHAGNGEFFQKSNYFKYLTEYFDKPFDTPLSANPAGVAKLNQYVRSLSAYYEKTPPKGCLSQLLWCFKKKEPLSPPEFSSLVNSEFEYFEGYEKAVGLLPMTLQMVQNCYPKGFKSVLFQREGTEDFLIYRENANELKIPLGFRTPKHAELKFEKNQFLTATQSTLRKNEDDQLVLTVRTDFLEFPSSRVLKFIFLDQDTILLKQSELPGKEFVLETIRDHIGEIGAKPILSGLMEHIGIDFFEFKAERAFAPEIVLKKKKQ